MLSTGDFVSTDCGAVATSDQGCGEIAESTEDAYGAGFNTAGGGVYAMKWDSDGISVFYFARDSIPTDITDGSPEPSGWGTPVSLGRRCF